MKDSELHIIIKEVGEHQMSIGIEAHGNAHMIAHAILSYIDGDKTVAQEMVKIMDREEGHSVDKLKN